MPATTVYAKGIQNFAASVSNGYLNFTYEVIDNYNDQTTLGDSTTLYSYYFATNAVSLKLITNLSQGDNILVELSCQNEQVSFASGEYYDIANGVTLEVGNVYSLIVIALGI